MDETALVPYSPPEIPAAPTGKPPVLTVLICAVAVLFYGLGAAEMIGKNGIASETLVKMMIGDLSGGSGNVYVLPKKGTGFSFDEGLNESSGDLSLDRLRRLESGELVPSVTNNETPYEIDMAEILRMPRSVAPLEDLYTEYGYSAPVVLIIHTHGTEAYADHAEDGYRTEKNDGVIGIGSVVSSVLRENGINTLHCEVAFDKPDFNMAYYSASLAIRDYLREYPSISYIIDVHRDSVTLPDGTYCKTEAQIGEKSAAQLMFVVGTDYGGSGHTGWRDNLALASRLDVAIEENNPGVMRKINLRAASFNEQYTKGSLLLEVGSCANTYDEAARAAEAFARALADEIMQK